MKFHAQIIKDKVQIITIVFLFFVAAICARLFYLQIYLFQTFQSKSKKNFLRKEKIYPKRGNILDCTGKLIATNKPIHNLYWQGAGTRELSNTTLKMLHTIEKITGKEITKDNKTISRIKNAEKYRKKILLASDISFDQLSKIEEKFSHSNTISISTSFKRFYPYGSFASHILGYLGRLQIDATGKMGLEKMLEETLKGKSGSVLKIINSFGTNLSETITERALSGGDIKTTLNINMQKIAERIFPKHETGAIIVMNPLDGSIVALVSRPSFDPNLFLSPILQDDWEKLQKNNPFLNRAFAACYPPGSILKLVSASAALETKIIDEDTTWNCNGHVIFGGRKYLCHKLDGHGTLTASEALGQSCNTFFYDIAQKIDIDTLADYAKRFGLGKKTNIILPEKKGLVPTKKWKFENKGEQWWPGENLSAFIGQSFWLTTPMQIACMTSSIFTGYLVKPRILQDEQILFHKIKIAEETLEFLRQSMKKVVTQGTGKNISRIKDLEIYAKTSTAQTSALHKRKLGQVYREHRWFVTYFRYKNNNPFTLVIIVEHSQKAHSAKNAAKKFLIAYKHALDRKALV